MNLHLMLIFLDIFRQLLSGVDNLRLMASTLENMHRIEESNDTFLNSDENSGPAL